VTCAAITLAEFLPVSPIVSKPARTNVITVSRVNDIFFILVSLISFTLS